MQKTPIAKFSELNPLDPTYALIAGVDPVIVRWKDEEGVSVLYGRCAYRPS